VTDIEVRRIRDRMELEAALDLREAVFCDEQGVDLEGPDGDRDGFDDTAVQLVAVSLDAEVVGTCRVVVAGTRGRFGRLCVRHDHRRQGLAAALLAEAEREARAAGCTAMGLHAQTDALALYDHAGYSPYTEPFDEAGIEHVGMEKEL
jgi:predicted GNAT family N-acyltransferase